MSTRTALTVVGGVVGAYFGYPQLGLVVGGLIGGAVDPQVIPGPKIGEIAAQSSADGIPRPIIYGTMACYGNVIQTGPAIKVEGDDGGGGKGGPQQGAGDQVFRTYAIRICEGPVAAILRVWQDNKLVYDIRPNSPIVEDSTKWLQNKIIYLGDEAQLPDPTLVASVNSDTPSYRGTVYIVFNTEDLTTRTGSIPQYRFEVARSVESASAGTSITHSTSFDRTTSAPGIYLAADGNLGFVYMDSPGGVPHINVNGGYYSRRTFDSTLTTLTSFNIFTIPSAGSSTYWNGDGINNGTISLAGGANTYAICGPGATFGGCYLINNGAQVASLKPDASFADDWWSNNSPAAPEFDGRRIWFSDTSVYVGTTARGQSGAVNNLCRWSLFSTGFPVYASAVINNICATPGDEFYTHFGNDQRMRIVADGEFSVYEDDLSFFSTETLPFSVSNLHGFGVDGDVAVFAYSAAPSARLDFRKVSDWSLTHSIVDGVFLQTRSTRVVFTDTSIFVQTHSNAGSPSNTTFIYRIPYIAGNGIGQPIVLGEIVADIHERCSIDSSMYDVTELTDLVSGFMLASDYTGADAISSPQLVYFYDKSEHDKKLFYPKRGAAVIETLTVDDLTEVSDTTGREQAIEIPKKLHLKYQHADAGYPPVKATISSSSPDLLTTGEVTLEVPIVLDEDQAIQTADKMYKVTRSELYGKTEITVPLRVGAKYVNGNCLGLSLRGMTKRYRLTQTVLTPEWSLKLTLTPDRQSAYTSNLTGVPVPDPTPPPSTIVGATQLAILDISARMDSEDDLSYLVAVSGSLSPWYGARYQRSFDAGATWTTVEDITTASVMGELLAGVADASEFFTDTTNEVTVRLYRDGQTLSSITEDQFLSKGNGFALEKIDGSWEIMQFRDAVESSDGSWTLSRLHRGQLESGTSEHLSGAKFVMLQRPTHIPAQSAWIGQSVTHRAISLGESADDTTNEVTQTFVGRSQTEWPVASLELTRSGTDISATWEPRHRFGSGNSPIASVNFQGFRVTIDDGVDSVTFDTTNKFFVDYDASALGSPVTVSVSSLNRITGAGPATSDSV